MTGDLHCHSTVSDGSMDVKELVEYASRLGLDCIALTDHDTMAGVSAACAYAAPLGVTIIPGVELSAFDFVRGRKVHLLCYFPQQPQLLEPLFFATQQSRNQALEQSMIKIQAHYPLAKQQVMQNAKDAACLYSVHIMQALIDIGYTDTVYGKLFSKLLSPTGNCYTHHDYQDVWQTARTIRQSGGVCVLAHPSVYQSLDIMCELAKEGLLDGIERNHPRNCVQDLPKIDETIEKYQLLATGGSDFHGGYSPHPHPLGTCVTTDEQLRRLFDCVEHKQAAGKGL